MPWHVQESQINSLDAYWAAFCDSLGREHKHKKVQRKTAKEMWYLTVLQLLDLPVPYSHAKTTHTKRCPHLANVFHVFRIVLHVFRQKYSV